MSVKPMTAVELGECLGIGARRVRQLAEEGRLVKMGRGLFDPGWAFNYRFGVAALGEERGRREAAAEVVAAGWLTGFNRTGAPVTKEDQDAWEKACARWHRTATEAAALLARGCALLGDRAPRFGERDT